METNYFDMLPLEIQDMILEYARQMEIEDDRLREINEEWERIREEENEGW